MKSYNHYSAVAKALDAVGDRWTLLIIRELVSQGPCRYTDLMSGLPGIATNLLADRLAALEEAGIVWREAVPPPVAATLYHLTDAGSDLEPVLDALGYGVLVSCLKRTKQINSAVTGSSVRSRCS